MKTYCFVIYSVAKLEVQSVITTALEIGYRHFDCAYSYMKEDAIDGEVFNQWITTGKIKREELFIMTKVGFKKK